MIALEDYIPIVGPTTVDELRILARSLEGRTVQNINSTAVGGGVAEILTRMIPLLQQLGGAGAVGRHQRERTLLRRHEEVPQRPSRRAG